MELNGIYDQLVELGRQRASFHRMEKGIVHRIKSDLKFLFPIRERSEISKVFSAVKKGGDASLQLLGEQGLLLVLGSAIPDHLNILGLYQESRKRVEKEISALVAQLPVWSLWAEDVKGIGTLGIGLLLAETGNPSLYDHKKKIFKRMGVALIRGQRQRKISGGEALVHGYNPDRRSTLWRLGDSMIKCSSGPYRSIYDREKKQIEESGAAAEMPKIQIHRRAQRRMEKRFLADFWKVCRFGDKAKGLHVPIRSTSV